MELVEKAWLLAPCESTGPFWVTPPARQGRRRYTAAAASALLLAGALMWAAGPARSSGDLTPRGAKWPGAAKLVSAREQLGHPIRWSALGNFCLQRVGEGKGSLVELQTCDAHSDLQRWYYHGGTKQRIKTSRGLCMDDGGKSVHIWDCFSGTIGANQRWNYDVAQGHLRTSRDRCLVATPLGGAASTLPCSPQDPKQQWEMSHPMLKALKAKATVKATTTAKSTMEKTTMEKAATEKGATGKATTIAPTTELPVEHQFARAAKKAESSKEVEQRIVAPTVETATEHEQGHAHSAKTTEFPLEVKLQITHEGGGVCLEAAGEKAHVGECDPSARHQTWMRFRSHQLRTLGGKCLDAASKTLLNPCDGARVTQTWYANAVGQIKAISSEKCLSSPLPAKQGSLVTLQACDPNSEAQKWNSKVATALTPGNSSMGLSLLLAVVFAAAIGGYALFMWSNDVSTSKTKGADSKLNTTRFMWNSDWRTGENSVAGSELHIMEPKPEATRFADPRPTASQNCQVGIVAFGYPTWGPCDELSCAHWLANGIDLDAYGMTLNLDARTRSSPEEEMDSKAGCTLLGQLLDRRQMAGVKESTATFASGILVAVQERLDSAKAHLQAKLAQTSLKTRSFLSAEAGFQSLMFRSQAQEFRHPSVKEAFQKDILCMCSQGMAFEGYDNEWSGMQAVLSAKFNNNPGLGRALERTGDAFLLCHAAVPGDGQPWSDNSDGEGSNWLGMLLMLLRDERSGCDRWTSFIESSVDKATGKLQTGSSPNTWQEAVRSARKALEAELLKRQNEDRNGLGASHLPKTEGIAHAAAPLGMMQSEEGPEAPLLPKNGSAAKGSLEELQLPGDECAPNAAAHWDPITMEAQEGSEARLLLADSAAHQDLSEEGLEVPLPRDLVTPEAQQGSEVKLLPKGECGADAVAPRSDGTSKIQEGSGAPQLSEHAGAADAAAPGDLGITDTWEESGALLLPKA